MIPTLQLGQFGQANNLGRVAWRAIGASNQTFAPSTDYALNLTDNQRDDGRHRVDPGRDNFILPSSGWYAMSAGYRTGAYPTTLGYNSTLTGATPATSIPNWQPPGWHENHMTTGYNAAKAVFCVFHAPAGSATYFSGNQYSGSNLTVTGNTIYQTAMLLHNNITPYGVDLYGVGTSLVTNTSTPLTYTSAYRDDGGFWNGPVDTTLVVPPGASGWYAMSGFYRLLDPPNAIGGARSWWTLNGTTQLGGSSTPCDNGSKSPPASAVYYLNEGDYVQYIADQNVNSTRTTERHRVGLTRVATTNGVCVTRSTGQNIASLATTAASFDTEVRDDLGAWTIADPTKLTVPTGGTGWYLINGSVHWGPVTGWDRDAILIVDGTTEIGRMGQYAPSIHNDPRLCITTAYYLTEGQYVEFHLRNGHTSSAVSTQGTLLFSMVKIDIG